MANSPYQLAAALGLGEDFETVDEYQRSSQSPDVAYLFDILQSASREDTVYRLVYDLNALCVHVVTNRYRECRAVNLTEFDFSPTAPPLALILHQTSGGNLADQFVPYSKAINRDAAEGFFRDPVLSKVFGWTITDEMLEYFAAYADSFSRA